MLFLLVVLASDVVPPDAAPPETRATGAAITKDKGRGDASGTLVVSSGGLPQEAVACR